MSYGTLQDTPPAAGRAKARFAPDTLLSPPSSHHPDEDSISDTQNATLWERARLGLKSFYDRNFGLFLVFLAQSCGSIVSYFFPLGHRFRWLTNHGLDESCSKVVS